MLRLRVDTRDQGSWRWDGAAYVASGETSRVEPLPHRMVEAVAVTDGARTLLVVRERLTNGPATTPEPITVTQQEFDRARSVATDWPGDVVAVETDPEATIRVSAGAARSTPLYLASDEETLHGSWDMADLRRHITGINPRETSRLLVYRPRYSAETLFTGISRLTERATATFNGALVITYPEPALHDRPRDLAPEADVLGALVDTLDAALDLRPLDPQSTLFHLTGGFDSGTIATRAAERHPGQLATATLLIGGPGRTQQIRRRKEIRATLDFGQVDIQIDAMVHPPLASGCRRVRGELISPTEEPLHHPFALMARATAAHGADTVMTGLGGDEMVALSVDEYPDKRQSPITTAGRHLPWIGHRARATLEHAEVGIAPPARINSMTLLALETTAPVLLREGLWPVHPFADTRMVQLGEQLPYDWRQLKQLQRRRFASLGLSDDVVHPTERESFAEVVQHALTTYGAPLIDQMLITGSILIDEGIVDADGLYDAAERLRSGPYREDGDAQLIEVLTLHLSATAFLGTP